MYKKEVWFEDGLSVFRIVARNGVIVARCKTESMADKIIKGLELLRIEELKIKNFRI